MRCEKEIFLIFLANQIDSNWNGRRWT